MNTTMFEIYTDGHCSPHTCGCGIVFPNNMDKNISESFPLANPTNQRAELYAILRALQAVWEDEETHTGICIYSDSMYSIKSCTIWYKTWETNHWISASGKPVLNQDIIRPILQKIADFQTIKNITVQFQHVKAHNGNPFNELADTLAKQCGRI